MHHYQALAVYYAIANTPYALPVFAARQRAACGAGAPRGLSHGNDRSESRIETPTFYLDRFYG